jgi:hypothetical protein
MIMVDIDKDRSYFIDIFDVVGGKRHDYSLHGPPGKFEMIGGEWSAPAKGTLAGENVAVGEFYDAPELGAKDYNGGFGRYGGSGFQHIFNVQTLKSGDFVAQWRHEKGESSQLRIRVLDEPGQTVMLAEARVSPVKYPQVLKYLITRRVGENISDRFVSVIEPFKDKPFIKSAKRTAVGDAIVIEVERDGAIDTIFYNPARKSIKYSNIETDAHVAVATPEKRVFFSGGSFLTAGQRRFTAEEVSTTVVSTDPEKSMIRTKPTGNINVKERPCRVANFTNDLRQTSHPIASVFKDGDEAVFKTKDDLLIGRARIDAIEPAALTTSTVMPLEIYRGCWLASSDFKFSHPVADAGGGRITLAKPLPADHPLKPGQDVWLVNVGVGDKLSVPAVMHWTSDGKSE